MFGLLKNKISSFISNLTGRAETKEDEKPAAPAPSAPEEKKSADEFIARMAQTSEEKTAAKKTEPAPAKKTGP